jgi:hypothetical protein
MNHGGYLLSFVDQTLTQYVPGLLASARLPIELPSEPTFELDPNDLVEECDDGGASEDDILADSVRAIYLEQ